jgi:hypothetical protein
VETLVTIANVEYFGRNQVIHSLPMRHGWFWIEIIVACYSVHVFVSSQSGVQPTGEYSWLSSRLRPNLFTAGCFFLLPRFNLRWQPHMWYWCLYRRWLHSRTRLLLLPQTGQIYTMQLLEEITFF